MGERLAQAEARGKELSERVDAAHAKHVECMEEHCVALQAAEREKGALGSELREAHEEAARQAAPHALLRDEHGKVLARCEALSADRMRILDMYSSVLDERNGFQDRLRVGSVERSKKNMRALTHEEPVIPGSMLASSFTSPRGYLSAREEPPASPLTAPWRHRSEGAREVAVPTSPMSSPTPSLSHLIGEVMAREVGTCPSPSLSPCVVTARDLRVTMPSSSPLKDSSAKLALDRAKDAQGIQEMYRRSRACTDEPCTDMSGGEHRVVRAMDLA